MIKAVQAALPAIPAPGSASLAFRRAGAKSVLASALASSPLRLRTPRNHGDAIWVFFSGLGGGFVGGDHFVIDVDVAAGAAALLTTQGSTKIYRSISGCSQRLACRVQDGASLAILPDPVVCFDGASYDQRTDIHLSSGGSLALLDSYTCGRSARGERWQFHRYASHTNVVRDGRHLFVDAVRLEPRDGSIADRMGRYEVILSFFAVGERFAAVRDVILAGGSAPRQSHDAIAAASPIGTDGAFLRVAATRFETAAAFFQPSFAALGRVLGDDPFARKW